MYLIKDRSKTSAPLKAFVAITKNQYGKGIKILRSDHGSEFTSSLMLQYYAENGIIHQTSCVGTPQQNGGVGCKHRHVLNVARALHFQAHLYIKF